MPATKRLVLDLPEATVAAIEARVAAGEYADVSDVVLAAVGKLDRTPEHDPGSGEWLRRGDEVVARLKAGREPLTSMAEVFQRVEASLHARESGADAA